MLETALAASNHPTADQIYDTVVKLCPSISRATVYRNLNRLCDDGQLLRVTVANAPDRFDRTIGEHCHFRCRSCGRVFDYVTKGAFELSRELNPDFIVTSCDFIVSGYCKSCADAYEAEKEEQNQ